MKNGFVIFLAAFGVLLASWSVFVLAPQLQLGGAGQVAVLNSSDVYPLNRAGVAAQGLSVYRANGCAACHTEQVQQTGVACVVTLTGLGVHKREDFVAFMHSQFELPELAPHTNAIAASLQNWSGDLPLALLTTADQDAAADMTDRLKAGGLKVELNIIATGPDITRGWGLRRSVAQDFLYDSPVQLGSLRIGPDLADVGRRLPDANWQLLHLYAPKSVVKDSAMPPFRYLFEVKKKMNGESSPDALNLPKEFAPADGYEVVPKPDARKLVAYLLSLHADVPLYDAPFTPAAPAKP